jgi:hypothetical protein
MQSQIKQISKLTNHLDSYIDANPLTDLKANTNTNTNTNTNANGIASNDQTFKELIKSPVELLHALWVLEKRYSRDIVIKLLKHSSGLTLLDFSLNRKKEDKLFENQTIWRLVTRGLTLVFAPDRRLVTVLRGMYKFGDPSGNEDQEDDEVITTNEVTDVTDAPQNNTPAQKINNTSLLYGYLWKSQATHVILTRKENGECGHLACFEYNEKKYLIIGSKNNHLILEFDFDIFASDDSSNFFAQQFESYKDQRFGFAVKIARGVIEKYFKIVPLEFAQKLFSDLVQNHWTICFEFVSKDNEHIVNYPSDEETRLFGFAIQSLNSSTGLCAFDPITACGYFDSWQFPGVETKLITCSEYESSVKAFSEEPQCVLRGTNPDGDNEGYVAYMVRVDDIQMINQTINQMMSKVMSKVMNKTENYLETSLTQTSNTPLNLPVYMVEKKKNAWYVFWRAVRQLIIKRVDKEKFLERINSLHFKVESFEVVLGYALKFYSWMLTKVTYSDWSNLSAKYASYLAEFDSLPANVIESIPSNLPKPKLDGARTVYYVGPPGSGKSLLSYIFLNLAQITGLFTVGHVTQDQFGLKSEKNDPLKAFLAEHERLSAMKHSLVFADKNLNNYNARKNMKGNPFIVYFTHPKGRAAYEALCIERAEGRKAHYVLEASNAKKIIKSFFSNFQEFSPEEKKKYPDHYEVMMNKPLDKIVQELCEKFYSLEIIQGVPSQEQIENAIIMGKKMSESIKPVIFDNTNNTNNMNNMNLTNTLNVSTVEPVKKNKLEVPSKSAYIALVPTKESVALIKTLTYDYTKDYAEIKDEFHITMIFKSHGKLKDMNQQAKWDELLELIGSATTARGIKVWSSNEICALEIEASSLKIPFYGLVPHISLARNPDASNKLTPWGKSGEMIVKGKDEEPALNDVFDILNDPVLNLTTDVPHTKSWIFAQPLDMSFVVELH